VNLGSEKEKFVKTDGISFAAIIADAETSAQVC